MQLRVYEFSKVLRKERYIAMFDARDISSEELHKLIETGKIDKDPRVVVMPQETFCKVFRSLTD